MKAKIIKEDRSILVITSYPPKGHTHHKAIVGVASYAKNTLVSLKKAIEKGGNTARITVLAEKLPESRIKNQESRKQNSGKMTTYGDNGIQVKRLWQRNNPLTFLRLLTEIALHQRSTRDVLIELELSMFGGKIMLVFLPLFLFFLRLLRKNMTVVLHQVILDMTEMSGHLAEYKKGLRTDVLNFILRSFYSLILRLSSTVVVFDSVLKERLGKVGPKDHVVVIPHGVEAFSSRLTKKQARTALKLPQQSEVILLFGFLAWYKGTDWMVDLYAHLQQKKGKKTMLVLAGGPNPNHHQNSHYLGYIKELKKKAAELGVIVTGFVPEEKIPAYFQAADLVVFPYRTFMSSSGPLSMAFSFKKPFLVSHKLYRIFDTEDMALLLEKSQLEPYQLTFQFKEDFVTKYRALMRNKRHLRKVVALSTLLQRQRSWEVIGKAYEALF